MKIGIVVGSIREGRNGLTIGEWIMEQARGRHDAEYVLVDLKAFDVPLLTTNTHPARANRQYESENVRSWSRAIDACDGFIFVTAEYNHGVPGAFKNAVDSLAPEWTEKAVAFVSYGSVDGVRAVEQWRQILVNFQMVDIREHTSFSMFHDFADDGKFDPADRKLDSIQRTFDQLEAEVKLRLGNSPT